MKKALALTLLLAAGYAGAGEDSRAWKFFQELKAPAAGVYRHKLPPAVLDAARPDLADLRLYDAAGAELPYLLETVRPARPPAERLTDFKARLEDGKTVLTARAGTAGFIEALALETPADGFIKPADAYISADGGKWTRIVSGVPVYRGHQGGENLRLEFPPAAGRYVKVVIDDSRSEAVPFTSLKATVLPARPASVGTAKAEIVSREDLSSSTRLTVKLPARNLYVFAALVKAEDELFSREVSVSARAYSDGRLDTRRLGCGTIFSTDAAGAAVRRDRVPVYARLDGTGELLLEIENGGSPALKVREIEVEYAPVHAVFQARAAGTYRLAFGNRQARGRSYDLGGLSGQLTGRTFPAPAAAAPAENRDYAAPEALPDLEALGAELDEGAWRYRVRVLPGAAGVQALDLDLPALTRAAPDLRDLRLASEGRQVQYILDRNYTKKESDAQAEKAGPALWKFRLPAEGLTLDRLTASAPDMVFRRTVRLYETPSDGRGSSARRLLATAAWSGAGGKGSPGTYSLQGSWRVKGDQLELEVDNGDNKPLELSGFRFQYPVSRLLFKWKGGDGPYLLYGNPSAGAPRYDIELVASELLESDKHAARLEGGASGGPGLAGLKLGGPAAKALFWAALIAVAVLLVFLIVRLLPPPK
ncbi:MAG TPA: DUF3999 family protein [Elusimicrobiales bacterium]|nr:DUF3999 family protein [Elusimicrobiales bacterium]